METGKETVEENPPPRSSESIVQVRSVYIELPLLHQMEVDELGCCNHCFTMRGFTFARRSSNQTVSTLFPSIDHASDSSEQLPPMEIPKFRYWLCPVCRLEAMNSGMVLVGIQQGPMAENIERIQSIGPIVPSNANAVESSISPQKTTTGKAVDVAFTGDINESTVPRKDAVEKISDEGKNAKAGEVITGGGIEVQSEKVNTDSGDISTELHKPANSNKHVILPEKDKSAALEKAANGIPGKIDEAETDRCRENDNSNGIPGPRRKIRKVRLLTDLLGEKGNLRVDTTERNPGTNAGLIESAGSGNAVLEGQAGPGKDVTNSVQSPKRKTKIAREDEETNNPSNVATNVKAPKKDTGKAIMVIDVPDSDIDMTPSAGEGLFIGSKTERLRRRSDIPPSLGRKKSKPNEVLDFAASLPSLVRSLPASSAAGSWGSNPSSEQTDRNQAGSSAGTFKYQSPYNRYTKGGLDLSLNSFVKKNHYLGSASKDFLRKGAVLFGESNTRTATESDRSWSKGQSWDLNERAAQISYNVEKGKFPVQKEMDFLQLGLKEKSSDTQQNPKESDQRADDIPMEIVELLAEKQYERRNSDTGNNPFLRRTSDTTRSFLDGEVIGAMKHLTRGYHGLATTSPPLDVESLATKASENAGINKGNPVTFSQLIKNHLKLVPAEENRKTTFATFPQNQQKISNGIQISPAPSVRTGLQYTEAAEPLLSSTSAKLPFGFGIQQKHAAQQHKGITISDIKADELKKTGEARLIFPKPGGALGASKAKGPLDTYANESIPALQLMSLMDGRSSGTAFGLGTSKILDKSFSPCSYHPRFSRDERQDFLNGSLISRQCLSKEPSSLRPAFLNSYQSSRPQSAALSSHISFMAPEKEMSSDKSQKSGSSTGGGPSSSHGKDKQIATLNGFNSMASPQKHQGPADSSRLILEPISIPGGVGPARSMSSDVICYTNRNPAEFSLPDAGNVYTICGRDLKFRKRILSRKKVPVVRVDGAKRQRVTKAKPGN